VKENLSKNKLSWACTSSITMGNGSSAYIVIEFENSGNICAGGALKGRLLLDVRKTISADYLMFRFYGHEKTVVGYTVQVPYYETVTVMVGDQYQTRQEQRFRTEHRTAYGSVNIFSAEVILHTFREGSIAQGQYSFPFEVSIPRGLPGSQYFNAGQYSSFLPSFLPSFHPSFHPSFLPPQSYISFHPSFHPSFLPTSLPSSLPQFLPSLNPTPTRYINIRGQFLQHILSLRSETPSTRNAHLECKELS
jgi:hypothetical protein